MVRNKKAAKPKKMSNAEAGKLGGEARKESLTPEERTAIAKAGGKALAEKMSDRAKRLRASKAGSSVSPEAARERARKAGLASAEARRKRAEQVAERR